LRQGSSAARCAAACRICVEGSSQRPRKLNGGRCCTAGSWTRRQRSRRGCCRCMPGSCGCGCRRHPQQRATLLCKERAHGPRHRHLRLGGRTGRCGAGCSTGSGGAS
jgi:hypothetical protein